MNLGMDSAKIWIISAIVILIAAAAYWYFVMRPAPNAEPAAQGTSAGTQPENTALGGSLYDKASNPVQDKLPGTVAPVVNPIEGIYKNPFQ